MRRFIRHMVGFYLTAPCLGAGLAFTVSLASGQWFTILAAALVCGSVSWGIWILRRWVLRGF